MKKEKCPTCGKTKGIDPQETVLMLLIFAFVIGGIASAIKYIFNL